MLSRLSTYSFVSFADKMIFAAAEFENGAAIFKTRGFRVSGGDGFEIHGGNINRGCRVRRNFNLPIEFFAFAMPFAADQAVRRFVRGFDECEIADGRGLHEDVLEAGLLWIRLDAGEVFVKP